jgi:hypothetical protein
MNPKLLYWDVDVIHMSQIIVNCIELGEFLKLRIIYYYIRNC